MNIVREITYGFEKSVEFPFGHDKPPKITKLITIMASPTININFLPTLSNISPANQGPLKINENLL